MNKQQENNLNTVKTYFQKVDARDKTVMELFDKNVQFFFPKFGISKGLDGFKSFSAGFGGSLVSILHNFEDYNYIVAGNTVVVEGSESGELKNGGTYHRNRFCSVFEFDNGSITRMHIYGDPDITGADTDRFLWGAPNDENWQPNEKVTAD